MKILLIGSGGREYAITCALLKSQTVSHVYVAPGNGGVELLSTAEPRCSVVGIEATDIDGLVEFASQHEIKLVIVGPEDPLCMGIVDQMDNHGILCFGPSQNAARLEGSKIFAKAFMNRHEIPTANWTGYSSLLLLGQSINEHFELHPKKKIVLKDDGLRGGKGVLVSAVRNHVLTAAQTCFDNDSDARVLLEECLTGEELSATYIVSKQGHILPLASSQDHKTRYNDDEGDNTGGMGAYSPAPAMTKDVAEQLDIIAQKVVAGAKKDDFPFYGVLYIGAMVSEGGIVRVLEFNVRFGDPECQVILARLQSDFTELVMHAVLGRLNSYRILWDDRYALAVTVVEENYPKKSKSNGQIIHLPQDEMIDKNTSLIFAGVKRRFSGSDYLFINSGRVLYVVVRDKNLQVAQNRANEIASDIVKKTINGLDFRSDIGHRAINQTTGS